VGELDIVTTECEPKGGLDKGVS